MIEFPDTPPMPDPPDGGYKTVMADPPWMNHSTAPTGSSHDHYDHLHPRAVSGMAPQVKEATAGHAHLYLWAAGPFVGDAFDVMESWGFDYKTTLVWVKTYNEPEPITSDWNGAEEVDPYMGMGYYFRSMTEVCLFGVKNNMGCDESESMRNTVFAPVDEHSEKPDAFYEVAERQSPGPRLEMFGRGERDGWDVWGDEA